MTRIVAAVFAALSISVLALLHQNSKLSGSAAIARREAAELRLSIERTLEVQRADRALMKAQFNTIEAFDNKIKELRANVAALPDRDVECLSADDTDRLRAIWAE